MDLTHCKGSLSVEPCYKLDKYQREAIGLLQIGTFLEYFDLMLYVHMAVVLNGLFFPPMDPKAEMAMSAMTFSSIYLLRPIGALIFGYIGDTIGRKSTIVLTTGLMAVSCIVIATLPTYSDIGIAATWVFVICRMLQGISSMGEIVGSEIYATELVQPPRRYFAVTSVDIYTRVGGLVALCVTWYVTNIAGNWRIAFWIGSCIAVVGSIARIRLRETPEFSNHLKMIKEVRSTEKAEGLARKVLKDIRNKKSMAFLFLLQPYQVSFYVAYIYFNQLLKNSYGLSSQAIITHNLKTSLASVVFTLFLLWACTKWNVLKINLCKHIAFCIIFIVSLFLFNTKMTYIEISIIQACFICIGMSLLPADALVINHFNITTRFTTVSLIWATSRIVAHLVFVAALVWLTERIGFNAVGVVFTPLILMYFYGLHYFWKLEQQRENAKKIFGGV
jgi:MHS family proline/betaine transporter-like MFS transporter